MALSDLAAKGATPYGVIFSLGIPEASKEQDILELIQGLNLVCQSHETFYLGGDTNSCCELVIDSTAIGIIQKEKIIRRKGAQPGDIVAITGEFGYTGAFFEAVLKNRTEPQEIVQKIKEKALKPYARLKEGQALAQANLASAAIDSSDGLAWSLHELAKASRVGFIIDRLKVSSICERFAQNHGLSVYDLALYGGEEFELVVTIPDEKWKEANAEIRKTGSQLLPIGIATKEKSVILKTEAEEKVIEARGYEHFKRR
jgi:thiamine-monophosphate kinase